MALLVKSLNGKSYEEILCFNNIKKLNKIDNNYPKDTLTLNCWLCSIEYSALYVFKGLKIVEKFSIFCSFRKIPPNNKEHYFLTKLMLLTRLFKKLQAFKAPWT